MQIAKQSDTQSSPRALSEYRSKQFLAEYGIPMAREILAEDRDQAVTAAKEIGYPVVLKACSPELMHKTEAGCVELNLASDEAVGRAFDRITASVTVALEGVLVAEMLPGNRELVMGLTWEPQFGPCVMLGLGGVMTEIFKDTVFRVAPFDRTEAEDMVRELKSADMLNTFRGEHAADANTICKCLLVLAKIGLERPDVSEIDINPLKILPNGEVKAVDALIVFNGKTGGRHAESD